MRGVRRRSYIGEEVMRSIFSSVQSLSRVQLIMTPWTAAHQASLSITKSGSLLRLMSIESVMPSNHLILCCPLLFLPAFNLSQHQGLLQGVSCFHQMANYWRFSISPSSEYSGLISFRTNLLDLLAVQGSLKSLLQHHSSKVSVLQRSAFFMVLLSHPYMTPGETIALTRRIFVGKVMSLYFHTPSRGHS